MKFLFYAWCLLRSTSLEVAFSVWFVYHPRRHAPWFKEYLGRNLFTANPVHLLLLAPIFDFLSDEGVAYVLHQIRDRRPGRVAMVELGLFTSDFAKTIGKHYLNGEGLEAYINADDFGTLRKLYLRNLLPIIDPRANALEEEEIMNQLMGFQLTPEMA